MEVSALAHHQTLFLETDKRPAPARNQRPAANPNLFKPPPPSSSPKPSGERRVAFRDTVDDMGDAYSASPKLPPKDAPAHGTIGAKASKWQPLSSVDPSPIADNDPFSLGDSEDEKDTSKKPNEQEGIRLEDSERVRAAAAEAMADSLVDDGNKKSGDAKKA
jgi:hypothetical protein